MKHLLSSTAYLVVNKQLARQVGLKAVVLLADLISKENYFIIKGTIKEGWFFNTSKNIERDTTLTNYQQKKAIKKLEEIGFIETSLKGMPATLHFKILENKISTYLKTSFKETSKQDLKKLKTNKNKEIIITNKNNNKKPSVEEIKDYCLERNNGIDAEQFFDFYESKGWLVGKNKMKCWKAAVRTWEKRKQKTTTSKIDQQLDNYNNAKKHLGL
jgi:hypothetical protein